MDQCRVQGRASDQLHEDDELRDEELELQDDVCDTEVRCECPAV